MQLTAIGWKGRQGLADAGNRFHYYRLTADNRILWGDYVPIYYFGNPVRDDLYSTCSTTPSELRGLELVREKPLPFPPEPLRWPGIELTRHSLARADATGRRNVWLRLLDRLGLGFDS